MARSPGFRQSVPVLPVCLVIGYLLVPETLTLKVTVSPNLTLTLPLIITIILNRDSKPNTNSNPNRTFPVLLDTPNLN